ncbi:Methyl-accepting chemotaxis sensor/transducer protein [hydrothermal vent metagenome]|uniref:Methyl-accepting chemotaxis sensor/transducer protein n=1 Tax=hydrothermal vent metagenome TaxID=652676 RepID=A0A3B1ATD2_9ZZZZ
MKFILSPTISLMNCLSYPWKMLLISMIFIVPLLITAVLAFESMSQSISLAKQEKLGIEYIQPLRQVMQFFPQHRGMTNGYLNGAENFKAKILDKRRQIQVAIKAVDAIDLRLGQILKTSEKWKNIKYDWESLQRVAFDLSAEESFDRHTNLINKVLKFLAYVSEQSKLILDPEINNAYLIDALVRTLPMTIENSGQARGLGAGIVANGTIRRSESLNLNMLINRINTNLDDAVTGIQVVFKNELTFKHALKHDMDKAIEAVHKFVKTSNNAVINSDEIRIDSREYFNLGTEAIKATYVLYDHILALMDSRQDAVIAEKIQHMYVSAAIIIIALLLAAYLFSGFYYSVLNTVNVLRNATKQLADGDLTSRANCHTRDELGQVGEDFNNMAEKFSVTISQVADSSTEMTNYATQLAVLSEQTRNNVDQQKNETEQVATAMNQMSATVEEVARHANSTAQETDKANTEVENGNLIVIQSINKIESLSAEIESAASVIEKLEQDSENIGTVLDVIRGIAEQTNLLALNAAIEAARAGEQGRGFAVVADEVRCLAQRTQESTQEIQQMIETLQSGAKNAVLAMTNGKEQARNSVEQSALSGTSLEEIGRMVTSVNDMSAQIASAAEEQSSVAIEVNRNIHNISNISQESSEAARQTAEQGENLAQLSFQLQTLVSHFKVKTA